MNQGDKPTCVRPQGSSIVDLTWTSPDLIRFVRNWRVEGEVESLSDHLYISFELSTRDFSLSCRRPLSRMWCCRKFDGDLFSAALTWRGYGPAGEILESTDRMAQWIDFVLAEACDVATDRIGPKKPKRTAYWWKDSAAIIRQDCLKARRRWQTAKKSRKSQIEIDELGKLYRLKQKELRREINRLKSSAWQELIDSIEDDPWGLPYKIVIRKLKASTLSLSEKLEENLLDGLLNSLFPKNNKPEFLNNWSNFEWSENWEIDIGEVDKAIRKVSSSPTKAPGPDGIRRMFLKRVNDEFLEWIRFTYNLCLRLGKFPLSWKCANLVLIPKAGDSTSESLPKTWPICLINDIAKAFERIIADRIYLWQSDHPESDFSRNQYGFRKFHSTCDAVSKFKEITINATTNGKYAIVIGLDIKNAFNSIPWRVIRKSLERKEFPLYIRRIIDSFLSDRSIQFIGRNGIFYKKSMSAGVPQGSVLGPVLWNIAFDSVLSMAENENHCSILCYADDTLVIVTGKNVEHTFLRAEVFVT
ncbi:hypothetical protein ACFW04_013267 [Cataglyphis niger]